MPKINRINPGDSWHCTWCGQLHTTGVYVAAHWDEELTHTCECGATHALRNGVIRPRKKGEKQFKAEEA